ncbi:MAG: ABC transporter permease, partial [Pseudomonadota bacterium]
VLNQAAMLAILAAGMSIVMIGGGIDLSLPANMALAGILGSMTMIGTDNVAIGCLTMIASGVMVGTLNGVAVAYFRMIPFVVTLAMMTVCGGLSVWLTNSVSIFDQPELFFDIFLARPFGLPLAILIAFAAGLSIQLIVGATRFGRQIYAIGTNAKAARISRVPVTRSTLYSYLIAGSMAGLAAIVVTARLGSASANVGSDNVVLDTVTACVIGGISIYGGIGRPAGAMFGAVFVIVLGNVLNLLGISFNIGLVLKGAIIIAFIALDRAFGEKR